MDNMIVEQKINKEFISAPFINMVFDDDKVFFTSDPHFGHKNIIRFCNRPYEDLDEMHKDMIERWNNTVPKDGIVFILGDVAFHMSKNKIKDILNQLNGKKYLIMGNHDRLDSLPLECFEHISMMDQIVIKNINIDGESEYITCILSHYPLMRWAGVTRGVISLHGHEHGNIPNKEYMFNQMDVGWDTFGQPYSWQDICESFTYRLMTNDGQPNVGF
jgi:calcineurin-like phosphoesterase family protein